MDYDSNGNRISETEPQSLPERYVDPNQVAGERMNIIKRLRDEGVRIADDAADEIEKLRAQAAEDAVDHNRCMQVLGQQLASLQAENERLRRTLQVIAEHPTWLDHGARAQGALARPHSDR